MSWLGCCVSCGESTVFLECWRLKPWPGCTPRLAAKWMLHPWSYDPSRSLELPRFSFLPLLRIFPQSCTPEPSQARPEASAKGSVQCWDGLGALYSGWSMLNFCFPAQGDRRASSIAYKPTWTPLLHTQAASLSHSPGYPWATIFTVPA